MTPKEKAEQLINKFDLPSGLMSIERKQCALIVVDEILKSGCTLPSSVPYWGDNEEATDYWRKVKYEIEEL